MAHCTNCGAEMPTLATSCSTCGWDFPEPLQSAYGRFYYTPIADFAIFVTMVGFWLAAIATAVSTIVVLVFYHDWVYGLIWGPLSTVTLIGFAFALGRVADIRDPTARRR